ncbi:MAG: alpha/beta fold hydrolase [Vicinamibacterales bacterium]
MTSCSRLRYLEAHPRSAVAWPADRPLAGTLVLLHAFPVGARMWEPQHAIAASGWRVVMPQFRGFDCPTPDGADAQTLDDYAGDVSDLLDTLSVSRAVIGGLSMGGYVAFALYRRRPELFSGLILADTRAEADTPDARTNRQRLIALAGSGGAAAIADEMVPKLLGATTRATQPAVEARLRALIGANRPAAIQAALTGMMTRDEATSLLPAIDVPSLVIVGEEDALTPPALSRTMASALPNATLAVIPGAGHLSNLEQPQAFNAEVEGFLESMQAQTPGNPSPI